MVAELHARGFHVVVVDDGTAPTAAGPLKAVQRYAAVIHHGVNRGKGRALRTGLEYVQRTVPTPYTVVTVDADGQHRSEDAARLCDVAEAHPQALILGARTLGSTAPLRSRLGNAVTRAVYRLTTRQALRDTQTGLRACSDQLVPSLLEIPGERYEWEMNVLVELAAAGVELKEIPIATIYRDANSRSHFSPVRDSWRIYRELMKYAGSSLLGFGIDYAVFATIVTISGGTAVVAGNIAARIVSGCVNFTVNHRLVFHSTRTWWRAAAGYAALSGAILTGTTLVLAFLVHHVGWSPYWAKIVTEMTFFAVSWLVQRTFVFRAPKLRAVEPVR